MNQTLRLAMACALSVSLGLLVVGSGRVAAQNRFSGGGNGNNTGSFAGNLGNSGNLGTNGGNLGTSGGNIGNMGSQANRPDRLIFPAFQPFNGQPLGYLGGGASGFGGGSFGGMSG